MDAFDATLKRAFAEASEPVDDGFSAGVSFAVARGEKAFVNRTIVQGVLMAAAAVAVGYGLYLFFQALGPQIMASVGLEFARAYGALGSGAGFDLATMGAGLTQIMLVMGALAGGAVLYRNSQT
jgi:hypothetical protein